MGTFVRAARAGIAIVALLTVAACSSSGSDTSAGGGAVGTATAASDLGGMDALIAAAEKEGKLAVAALPPGRATYDGLITAFRARYDIEVDVQNPDGPGAEDAKAVKDLLGSGRVPDVLDIGMAQALANAELFAPYKVITWADIPDAQKEPTGLWFQGYGGYMAIGYDPAKVPAPASVADLLKPAYKGTVALTGDPTRTTAALNGVMMASLATGGTPDDISKGVDFFRQLKGSGNVSPVPATSATVKSGATPVVLDWDYLSAARVADVPAWKVFVPPNAMLGGYHVQAVTKAAPHPAAARLWEEFLYSDEGQNLWLKGGARPVRMARMTEAGTIDATAAAALPKAQGTPHFLTGEQATKAKAYLAGNWAKAIG